MELFINMELVKGHLNIKSSFILNCSIQAASCRSRSEHLAMKKYTNGVKKHLKKMIVLYII